MDITTNKDADGRDICPALVPGSYCFYHSPISNGIEIICRDDPSKYQTDIISDNGEDLVDELNAHLKLTASEVFKIIASSMNASTFQPRSNRK